MEGIHSLDVDIDNLTKDKFQIPLGSGFLAMLSPFMIACEAVKQSGAFLGLWGRQHGKAVQTLTIEDAFQAIKEIEEKDVGILDTAVSALVQLLPLNGRLALTIGLCDLKQSVVRVIQHALGHMVGATPEMALDAHLYELAGSTLLQLNIDEKNKQLCELLGKPPPPAMWKDVHDHVNKSINRIAAHSALPVRLATAIDRCIKLGEIMDSSNKLYEALQEELRAKRAVDEEGKESEPAAKPFREKTDEQRFAEGPLGREILMDRPKDADGDPEIHA